jgi:hypothetical protein
VVLHKIPRYYIKREILQIYPTPPILACTAHNFFLYSQTTPHNLYEAMKDEQADLGRSLYPMIMPFMPALSKDSQQLLD